MALICASYSSRSAEGTFHAGNYLFFDDMIDSGETVVRVWNAIEQQVAEENKQFATRPFIAPTLIGAVLYSSYSKKPVDFHEDYRRYMYGAPKESLTIPLPTWCIKDDY